MAEELDHGMGRVGHISKAEGGAEISERLSKKDIVGKVALLLLLAGWQQGVWVLNIFARIMPKGDFVACLQ